MSWDRYFHDICKAVAENSKCLSRQIGAILVKDKTIIGTGYNGPPRGIPHCGLRSVEGIDAAFTEAIKKKNNELLYHVQSSEEGRCPRRILGFKSGEGLEWCVAGHAERNALINSARLGIPTWGTKMYMNCGIPCTPCLVEIINAGVEEIILTKFVGYDQMSEYLLRHSGIKVRVYDFKGD